MQAPWLAQWVGSRWLPGMVSLCIVAALATVLLEKLDEIAGDSERLLVDLTERNMRVGLQLAVAEAITHGREARLIDWVGGDPSVWLGQPPVGYLGRCVPPVRQMTPGGWCFDPEAHTLWYRPRHDSVAAAKGARGVLGWQVVAAGLSPDGRTVSGLRVESVTFGRLD